MIDGTDNEINTHQTMGIFYMKIRRLFIENDKEVFFMKETKVKTNSGFRKELIRHIKMLMGQGVILGKTYDGVSVSGGLAYEGSFVATAYEKGILSLKSNDKTMELNEAFVTGAIWAGICIVFDVFGWVIIKHPWSLSFKEFYVDYQPWITLIYIAIFLGPVIGFFLC